MNALAPELFRSLRFPRAIELMLGRRVRVLNTKQGTLEQSEHDFCAVVNVCGPMRGALLVRLNRTDAEGIAKSALRDRDRAGEVSEAMIRDTLGELANQLANELAGLAAAGSGDRYNVEAPCVLSAPDARVATESTEFCEARVRVSPFCMNVSVLAARADAISTPDAVSAKPTALIADDSLLMRRQLADLLTDLGWDVPGEAGRGDEALALYRRLRPDLVLLDINMPGMDGIDTLKLIKVEDPDARVLISSSVCQPQVLADCHAEGAAGFLRKPFDRDRFASILTQLQGSLNAGRHLRLGGYEIGPALGCGGMGTVHAARDISLHRDVAIKILHDKYSRDPDYVQRFLREARAMAQINHPHVVQVYAAGTDRGKHYFVMERLARPDLFRRIHRDGPLPVHAALRLLRQAARGLRACQRRNIVHHDVKPANLMCTSDGMLRVCDFGLAHAVNDTAVDNLERIEGTPHFLAPEKIRRARVDYRADIYSLGATLYFMATGHPPFPGQDTKTVLQGHLYSQVPALLGDADELNPLVQRMMAKKPADRFANYDDLIKAIDVLLNSLAAC